MRPCYFFAALAALVFAAPLAAQTPGTCAPGEATRELDLSDVRARLFTNGNLFSRTTEAGVNSGPGYLVPAYTGPAPSAALPAYTAGLWLGGTRPGGAGVRVAAARYRDYEFWPGPLNTDGTLPNASDCSAYDRIWVVSYADVAAYEASGTVTPDLTQWPVGLGADAVDAGGTPIVTTDRARVINLAAGERPVVYGSQTAFWVMNDVGNAHVSTGSAPLGVEVQVTAFSVYAPADPALNQATFYRYDIINRGEEPIFDFAVSAFLDPDVGNYADDYIGTDPVRGLAYGYNADNDDEGAGGYGAAPPAFGVDFIGGPPVYRAGYYSNDAGSFGIPTNALEYYRYMTGFFREGQPWTEGGTATTPGNPPVNFVYPDTPGFYWSEPCSAFSGPCVANTPGERRVVASTLAEESRLDIGEQETFTFAMLFARGGSNFNSVTALAAASDHVQALHDSGALFTAGHTALPPALAAPAPTAPEDGAGFPAGVTRATLTWSAVPGATVYEVVVDTAAVPFQGGEQRLFAAGLSVVYPFTAEGGAAYRWRVRALALGTASPFSTSRTFTSSGFPLPGISEAAVVEVARPGGADPCAGAPADVGCQDGLGGNTVFHDGDRGADYYLTGGGSLGDIVRLSRYAYMAFPDYFEIRFTATGGYGLYFPPDNHVVRVPFELWNVRTTPDDPTDDVRMIPLINPQTAGDTPTDWTNHLTGTDAWSGRPRPVTPASDWIYWMMPDRPGGYALFETAALAFGGPGALYDPTADGDAQVEPDPYNGGACTNQGNYVSWCYRNTEPETNSYPTLGDPGSQFIYPIGRLAFADLAGDGTTPPTGTVVRFRTFQIGSVVASEPVPTGPVAALAVERVAPNPARGRALLVYAVPVAGRTVVAVYDALGRRVAVVQDGPLAAGRHEVELETAALAPGVYVVVVESRGARAARTLAVVR